MNSDKTSTNRLEAERAYVSGNYGDSETLFRAAVLEAEESDPQSVELAVCLMGLAQLYSAQWKHDLCEQNLNRALTLLKAQLPSDHHLVIGCMKEIGLMYQIQEKYPEAEAYYRMLLEVVASETQPRHELSEVLTALVEIFKDQARLSEAEAAQKRLIEVTEKLMGPEHPELAQQMLDLAELYEESASYEKAGNYLRSAIQILRKTRGANHPQSAACLKRLIDVQEKERKRRELAGADISWQG